MNYFKYHIGYIFPQITRILFTIFTLALVGILIIAPQTITFIMKSEPVVLNKVSQFFFFTPFITWGLIMIFLKEFIDIKIEEKKLKYSYNFLGIKFGSWEDIPDNSRIIFDIYQGGYNSSINTSLVNINQVSYKNTSFKIKLFLSDHNNQITLAKGRNKDKLFKKVKPIADTLSIEIEDLTKL